MRKVIGLVACLGVIGFALPAWAQAEKGARQCPAATIDIVILTDSYGDETTWEVTDHYTSAQLCSGGPYADYTTYNIECCVAYNGCYDFTIYDAYGDGIYSPGGYSVSYEGTLLYSCIGSGWSGDSEMVPQIGDDCPLGACCVNFVCVATNSYWECDAMGGTWYVGETCPDFECPIPPTVCPPDTLNNDNNPIGQPVELVSWTGMNSDQGGGYLGYENFWDNSGIIQDVHWWGITAVYSGGWQACDKPNERFEITFYNDAAGEPGAVACGPFIVTPTKVDTGETFSSYPLYAYHALIPDCTMTAGWVSILGLDDGQNCWFLWARGKPGDGSCKQWDSTAGSWLANPTYDLTLCLTGEYVPTYGACCDDDTAICVDNVEIMDCPPPLRFAANTLCDDMVPPCGTIVGACCLMDGTCAPNMGEAQCTDAGGFLWLANTPCIPNPCPLVNDECENAIKIDPGQILSGDTTNATHSSTFPGATAFCGTSSNTSSKDVWYKVTGNGKFLTADLCASSYDTKVQVWKAPCDDPVCVGGNDDACGKLGYTANVLHHKGARAMQSEYTWCSTPGQEYLIRVYGWSSNTGAYVLEIVQGDMCVGACCVDSNCVIVSQQDCNDLGGEYQGGGSVCDAPDCNGNGMNDSCDIYSGASPDCQPNGIPDECDVAEGTSEDCQPDGIPDECQLAGDRAVLIDEGFEDITNMPGWYMQNNSVPLGGTNWFQGSSGVFLAQAGPADSYIGANYNNTGSNGDISNWLVTPEVALADGSLLEFYTRGPTGSSWADRLEVRMSLNGASTDVGTGYAGVGDFTILLLSVNETLVGNGYPQVWDPDGHYVVTLAGVGSPTTGRLALRYFVPDGGAWGTNSNYIGIDTVTLTETGGPPPWQENDCNQNGVPDECDIPICGNDCIEGGAGPAAGMEEECDGIDDEACPLRCYPPGHQHECMCPFCGDGLVDGPAGEECDDGNNDPGDCCSPNCQLEPDTTVCRPAVDLCDEDEFCTGNCPVCPPDAKKPAGTLCRASTDPCDPEEVCDGVSDPCPVDFWITACINNDGCCPPGCNNNNDSDCAVVCGNGVIEVGEKCDPPDDGFCLIAGTPCETDANCPAGDVCHRYPCNENCQFSDDLIPTVSTWGLVVLALLLLTGAKVYFRRRTA